MHTARCVPYTIAYHLIQKTMRTLKPTLRKSIRKSNSALAAAYLTLAQRDTVSLCWDTTTLNFVINSTMGDLHGTSCLHCHIVIYFAILVHWLDELHVYTTPSEN